MLHLLGHTLRNLLLGEMLLLSCHEVLLFLLPTLKSILLIGRKCCAERRKAGCEWWLCTTCTGARGSARTSPGIRSVIRGWTMGNADLRNQERLPGITNSPDELRERLILRIFELLYEQLR
jgi:hypothetical protein